MQHVTYSKPVLEEEIKYVSPHGVGKTLKHLLKVCFVALICIVLNAILAVLFNHVRTVSPEVLQAVSATVREFTAQNSLLMWTVFSQYTTLNVSLRSCAMFTMSVIVAVVSIGVAVYFCVARKHKRYSMQQKATQTTSVFSYKQHVAFLA